MSAIGKSSTLHDPKDFISFELPSKKNPSIHKTYFLELGKDANEAIFLGKGPTGSVRRIKANVSFANGKSKEKEYALKEFNRFFSTKEDNDACLNEFKCHSEIMRRLLLQSNHDFLNSSNISPGTGIEKKPIYAFNNCMLKKLYDMNLSEAIKAGCFKNLTFLISGSKQLLEGMISLATVGALYFDIKLANIIVKITGNNFSLCSKTEESKFSEEMNQINGKIEVAFTDFEQISFLDFNEEDNKTVRDVFIRMPPFLAHEDELSSLHDIRLNDNPAKEFIEKLNKLYVFALGNIFFEMTTKVSLKRFLILKTFTLHLSNNGYTPDQITKFWNKACLIDKDKNLRELVELIEKKDHLFFLAVTGQTQYPDLELLQLSELQQSIHEHLLTTGVPEFYINLIISMIDPDAKTRINLYDALDILSINRVNKKQKVT